MYDATEGGQVELKAMLAVVVLLGLIRFGAAFAERDSTPPVAPADAAADLVLRGDRAPEQAIVLAPVPLSDSTALAAETLAPPPAVTQADAVEDVPAEAAEPPRPTPPPPPPPPGASAAVPTTLDEAAIAAQLAGQVHLTERTVAPTAAPRPTPPPPAPSVPVQAAAPPPRSEIFELVEQMPVLQGGLAGLQRRITYPERARAAQVEGRVFVQFVVDEQGRPSDVRVVRGIGAGCDEAAAEAIRGSRFTPGLQRGQPVKVRMALPVTFRLND